MTEQKTTRWHPITSVPPHVTRAWLRDYCCQETIAERSQSVASGWVQMVTRREVQPAYWMEAANG